MKQIIRKQMIDARKQLTQAEKERKDHHIIELIKSDKRYQKAKTVGLFYPMASEINLLTLLEDDKIFLFPKVNNKDIEFYVYDKKERFIKSAFGVYEPETGNIYNQQIDYLLVPALALDSDNHRIGYGKGFYDRYLKTNRPVYAIGVIYTFQLVNHIESSSVDEQLDGYLKG